MTLAAVPATRPAITGLALLGCALLGLSACSSPAAPNAQGSTRPPERTSGPPASDVPTAADDPSPSGPSASANCLSATEVIAALRRAGVVGGDRKLKVAAGPDCAGNYVAARLSAPGTDGLQVILRRHGQRLKVVTAGSGACSPQQTAKLPTSLRRTLGCG